MERDIEITDNTNQQDEKQEYDSRFEDNGD